MNGIEHIKKYYCQLPFSTTLQNKLTVDVCRSIFERVVADPEIPNDVRLESITSSKLSKYLVYYDFVRMLPENNEDGSSARNRGVFFLHRVFGGRDLSNDEKNCYAVLFSALEDRYEKYDGSGYPKGKRKDEICVLAQILAIGESIAMGRLGCSSETSILMSLTAQSGVSFNPKIVEIAKKTVAEMFDKDRQWFDSYGTDDSGLLQMEYQPIFDCTAGTVCGYENRMILTDHNQDGLLPAVYVPVAEKSNRIMGLVELQLEKICQQFSVARLDDSVEMHPIWVSVSVVCLKRKIFVQTVKRVLSKYQIDPENLTFEITETALGHEDPQIPVTISMLREIGIRIVLDHFGTEYSSLSALGSFEIDAVKLDEDFTQTICNNKKTYEIVSSIIKLAQKLDIDVMASGVNKIEQREALSELSCRYMQGELFGIWDSL